VDGFGDETRSVLTIIQALCQAEQITTKQVQRRPRRPCLVYLG
jgi:hypothetical protein